MFDSSKLWHRLRGHTVALVPFDPATAKSPLLATIVRDRCTCGAEWVFYGLTMTVTFVPRQATLIDERTPWCNACGAAVHYNTREMAYFHSEHDDDRPACEFHMVPTRSVRGF